MSYPMWSTAEEAIAEVKVKWETMERSYRKHDEEIPVIPTRREYSGQFNVLVDKRIHRALAVETALVGISLNALVSQANSICCKSMLTS